jgi:hypothetical protein
LPVTAKRVFRTQKEGQKSILVQIVEGESASPEDCSQIGRCVARDLPVGLPAQTPIEVRFSYQENGRLSVHVTVGGTRRELKHEIMRDNTMTPQQLDAWRLFVTGQPPSDQAPREGGDSAVVGRDDLTLAKGGSTILGGSSTVLGGSSILAGGLSDITSGSTMIGGTFPPNRDEPPPEKSEPPSGPEDEFKINTWD